MIQFPYGIADFQSIRREGMFYLDRTSGIRDVERLGRTEEDASRLAAATFKGLELRSIGPALMAGRIADIVVVPRDQSSWFVAVGSGGGWEAAPPSVSRRLFTVAMAHHYSAYGPTPHHLDSLRIVEQGFATLRDGLDRLIDVDLPALEEKLDAAGVPWTPGRSVPGRK